MAGLTVTEKEHWKDRIARRIDKRIEAISAQEPNLLDRIPRQARERALASLGLAEQQAELDRIEEQETVLEKRKEHLHKAMLAHVQGVPIDDVCLGSYYRAEGHPDVSAAVKRRQDIYEDELLAESELGRRILQLRHEKDELLDTVWLASSPKQLKVLWEKVAELLGDELSPLQREALAIEPVQEGG